MKPTSLLFAALLSMYCLCLFSYAQDKRKQPQPNQKNIQQDPEMMDSSRKVPLKIGYKIPLAKENYNPTAIYITTDKYGNQTKPRDCSAVVYLKVSNDSLVLDAEIRDDTVLSQGDAFEIFIIDTLGGNNAMQWIITAPDTQHISKANEWDFRGKRALTTISSGFQYKTRRFPTGYKVRATIYLPCLGLKGELNQRFAMQFQVVDRDKESENPWVCNWHPGHNTFQNTLAAFPMYIDTSKGERIDFSLKAVKSFLPEIIFKIQTRRPAFAVSFYENGKKVNSTRRKKSPSENAEYIYVPRLNMGESSDIALEVRQRNKVLGYFPMAALPYLIDTTKNREPFMQSIDRLDYIQKKATQPKGQLVFYGHSYFGYWFTLKDDMPGFNVINRGLSGAQVQHLIPITVQNVSYFKPSVIVLYIGVNDISAGDTPINAFEEFKQLVEKLETENSKASFVVLSHTKKHYKEQPGVKKYDDLVREYVKNKKNFEYCDLTHILDPQDPNMSSYLLPDLAHLNAKGYALVAPEVIKSIQKVQQIKQQNTIPKN